MIPALVVGSLVVFVLWAVFGGVPKRIDTSFATSALLRFHYDGKRIDVAVTEAKDLDTLKSLLAGYAYGNETTDYPACMFDPCISITLVGGGTRIMFCPSFCGDGLLEINQTGKYLHISPVTRRRLERVCRKHGVPLSP